MGFNTVVVVLNDRAADFSDEGPTGASLYRAIMHWPARGGMGDQFQAGSVVSMAHADYDQVVVVGQNRGRMIDKADGLGWYALDRMADCLRRHGWTAKPPSRRRKSPSPARNPTGGE